LADSETANLTTSPFLIPAPELRAKLTNTWAYLARISEDGVKLVAMERIIATLDNEIPEAGKKQFRQVVAALGEETIKSETPIVNLEIPVKNTDKVTSPAIVSDGSVWEIPRAIWDGSRWKWVVVISQKTTPKVGVKETDELLAIAASSTMVSNSAYQHELLVPDHTDDVIGKAMQVMTAESRRIPWDVESVMILSCGEPTVNQARSRVACCLQKIIAVSTEVTGNKPPVLICNGYQWQVDGMHEVAHDFGIDTGNIKDVVLQPGEHTMFHGWRMVEQLQPIPNSVAVVTSVEHELRSAVHLHDQVGWPLGVQFTYFQAPTPSGLQNETVPHEIERLKKYKRSTVARLGMHHPGYWDKTETYWAVPLWARACMGDLKLD
jgi:hypothetical protein